MTAMHTLRRSTAITVFVLATAAMALAGCRGDSSEDPPLLLMRNMWRSQRYNHQGESSFFADRRAMRNPPAGTVARDNFEEDDRLTTGLDTDGTSYVLAVPDAIAHRFADRAAMLARGRERYGIYCTPCHGDSGDGRGVVPQRAAGRGYSFPEPPTFHQDRLRHAPDGLMYAVITNGVRAMPGYAAQIPLNDRWAIVAYTRALQLSQANSSEARP